MRTLLGVTIAAIALAAIVPPAMATTEIRYQTAQGGVVCKPSDMTSNSSLKAKATGFRNEGTASYFAICGFESSNTQDGHGTIQAITLGLFSLNGVSSTVSCTAVNGFANGSPIYSTKSVALNSDGSATTLNFDASDFGGIAGDYLPASDYWSVTCTLPGKSSIGFMRTTFTVNAPVV